MREKASQARFDEDRYGYRSLEVPKKRLDLNDLLKRAKDQKKNDKKLNLLIYSGAASVLAVSILFLSL